MNKEIKELNKKISGGKRIVLQIQEIKKKTGVCGWYNCESTENLQFAHVLETNVKGMGRGSWTRLNDYLQNKRSYMIYCEYHHKLYDSYKNEDEYEND